VLALALATIALFAGPPQGDGTVSAAGPPLTGETVVLDPGHNGGNGAHPDRINRHVPIGGGQTKACDTTGTATASGYAESRYNLAVAHAAARILRRQGATVILTRESNGGVGPCISRRARIGNRAGADAAVSIHADGGPAGGRGFHVIHPTRIPGLTDDIFSPSRRLARALRSAYAARTGIPPATYLGGNGLVARSDLGGLRLSDVPKVFVETGNMRNAADAAIFQARRGRQRIARGIADGLSRFLKRDSPSLGS
jgi:N-acetylmuramoyl-L-alanine amidase